MQDAEFVAAYNKLEPAYQAARLRVFLQQAVEALDILERSLIRMGLGLTEEDS